MVGRTKPETPVGSDNWSAYKYAKKSRFPLPSTVVKTLRRFKPANSQCHIYVRIYKKTCTRTSYARVCTLLAIVISTTIQNTVNMYFISVSGGGTTFVFMCNLYLKMESKWSLDVSY